MLAALIVLGQHKTGGTIFNSETRDAVPFATVKFGNTGQGLIAGLDGKFEIPGTLEGKIDWIEISCLGYKTLKITLPASLTIYLEPEVKGLSEVVVKPPYDKIRRILDNAIAEKNANNPDKYDWYRCHVYYKMTGDLTLPDSIMTDTSARNRKKLALINNQHLLMSETKSIRTWSKPQHLQEDVLASKFSGLKKSVFANMITDVLPFHTYTDYLTLNGRDYHNPVSRGYEQYYRFNLADEVLEGQDTTWVLTFKPKGHNANELKGTVCINSAGYAISRMVAMANDTLLKMDVRIEEQYEHLQVDKNEYRWFPRQINYIIDWEQQTKKMDITLHMRGNSVIDSVTWKDDHDFRFDKLHTVLLEPGSGELSDSAWNQLRPAPLDKKEMNTYHIIDSLGSKIHMDNVVTLSTKLAQNKLPIGILDFDIRRFFSYNTYEGLRLGAGIQTNELLVKWLSLGGWAGYGNTDFKWKYGGFAEIYGDRFKDLLFRGGYNEDLSDPGRVHVNRDLDKNYLNYYLLQRVDETKTWFASVRQKTAYWNIELSGNSQRIIPKYAYALNWNNQVCTTFTANEASLRLRYAYAERNGPVNGTYYSLGTKYPIWYGKITLGTLESGNYQTPYAQAVTTLVWRRHLNRLGFENIMIEGGKSISASPLPLSKLFAGNGYRYDLKSVFDESIYTFGGMMTIYPYQFYSDQFVNLLYRHDFDWKLYKLASPKSSFSSAPNICLQYNLLYGTLKNPQAQQLVAFQIPDNAYNEVGLLLNNLVRLRYGHLYYLVLNFGYFYHPDGGAYADKNGRFVMGAGVEL